MGQLQTQQTLHDLQLHEAWCLDVNESSGPSVVQPRVRDFLNPEKVVVF